MINEVDEYDESQNMLNKVNADDDDLEWNDGAGMVFFTNIDV